MTTAMLAPYTLRAEPGMQETGAPGSITDVAHEFEAQFIYQLLKQMRESMSMALGGGEDGGFGFETLGSTLDIELARTLSRQGGIGLARVIAEAAARQGAKAPSDLRTLAPSDHLTFVPSDPLDLFEGKVTSNYGWRNDPFSGARTFHGGVDIAMAYGVDVPAAEDGRVVAAGAQGRYGNTVVIEHASGARTRYAHLSEITVQPGQAVTAGSTIGRAGSSGAATGPHLHFEVIVDDQKLDPLSIEARASL